MLEVQVNDHLQEKKPFRKKKALKEASDLNQVCYTLDFHSEIFLQKVMIATQFTVELI